MLWQKEKTDIEKINDLRVENLLNIVKSSVNTGVCAAFSGEGKTHNVVKGVDKDTRYCILDDSRKL